MVISTSYVPFGEGMPRMREMVSHGYINELETKKNWINCIGGKKA